MDPHFSSFAPPLAPALELAPSRPVVPLLAPAASPGRLAVAREMLATLETLTNAGQRHLMEKIVALIEGHVVATALRARERRRGAALQLSTLLKRESERRSPRAAAFRGYAERLIALLTPLG
jgi:hypothetical protein